MKKIVSFVFIGMALALSGCSVFGIHKMDIEQGNIIAPEKVSQLRIGMSEADVKEIMGTPMLVNIFTPYRIDYVYTLQVGYRERTEKFVTCIFQNGRLREIQAQREPLATYP